MTKHYAARNTRALGEHFTNHLSAMTGEKLHAKFAIAAELAWRDWHISALVDALRLIGEKAHEVQRADGARDPRRVEDADSAGREAAA